MFFSKEFMLNRDFVLAVRKIDGRAFGSLLFSV